jgi:4-amino-4-deoxy-L-arabinose transferase-like glycosyltransferase
MTLFVRGTGAGPSRRVPRHRVSLDLPGGGGDGVAAPSGSRSARMLPAPFVFVLAAIWMGFLSWLRPLALPDEGRYPGVAWEMLRAGSHGVPLLDGMPFFHKPPLYYWLAEASFNLFGVHPWAARLPSLLAAAALAAGVYAFVRRYRGATAALVAVLALVTQPFLYGAAQFANLDMLVAGLIGLTTLAGASVVLRAESGEPRRLMAVSTAVLAGLGVLAKGLIGLALPGLVLLVWIALGKRWRGLGALLWPPAILAFAVVCVPWFWFMQQAYPEFFDYFFILQQFDRYSGDAFNNRQPIWFYLPVVAGLALPWTLWLGGTFRKAFWRADDPRGLRSLMAIWIIVILAFFSLPSSKLIGYILPVLAPVAVLAAEVIMAALGRDAVGARRNVRATLAVAMVLCVVGILVANHVARPNAAVLARAMRKDLKPQDTLVMLHAYAYDLPMALGYAKPAWVVDDWDNPKIPLRDNWRKELYDAGQFRRDVMKQALISPAELQRRICAAPADDVFWIWGRPSDRNLGYSALKGVATYAVDGNRAIWRVVADAGFRADNCGGMPITGS